MKTAISIPDGLFEKAERLAERLGLSRSGLYARALQDFLARRAERTITRTLDEVYSDSPSDLPRDLAQAQSEILEDEGW